MRLRVSCGMDHVVDEAARTGHERVGEAGLVFGFARASLAGSPLSSRKMISTAPLAPITAISALGQA
jgi:hypothetical protein